MTAQFSVSISFLDNLLRLNRTSDLLTALSARNGPAPHLDPLGSLYLKAYLVQQPDATLSERCKALVAARSQGLSQSAMGRAVIGLGWNR